MNLHLLRHGVAEDLIPGGGMKDPLRRLTPEGIRKIKRVAKGMQIMEIELDVILTSPFLRAKETACLVANRYKMEKSVVEMEPLAADGNPKELIDHLRKQKKKWGNILLVGHEPYLSRLISLLISGDCAIPITLKKGGLCLLSTKSLHYGRCATLEWLLTPGQNRKLRS